MFRKVKDAAPFGALVAGTFGLGVWQTQRYSWKIELQQARRRELALAPTSLEEAQGHRRVAVRGRLEKGTRVGPRAAPFARTQGLSTAPQGYEILAVLVTDERRILVNRGWAPRGVEVECPEETVELVGIMGGERKGTFSPVNTKDHVLWIEVPFLAAMLKTEEILLTVVDDKSNESWPRPKTVDDFQNFPVDPPTHAAYAATWFALSAAGALMTRRLLSPLKMKKKP